MGDDLAWGGSGGGGMIYFVTPAGSTTLYMYNPDCTVTPPKMSRIGAPVPLFGRVYAYAYGNPVHVHRTYVYRTFDRRLYTIDLLFDRTRTHVRDRTGRVRMPIKSDFSSLVPDETA